MFVANTEVQVCSKGPTIVTHLLRPGGLWRKGWQLGFGSIDTVAPALLARTQQSCAQLQSCRAGYMHQSCNSSTSRWKEKEVSAGEMQETRSQREVEDLHDHRSAHCGICIPAELHLQEAFWNARRPVLSWKQQFWLHHLMVPCR